MDPEKTRTAVVTGGASGLGLAIAEKFVQQHIFTIIIGRDAEKLQRARARLGPHCASYAQDLSRLEELPGLVQRLTAAHGPVDILVNNAGINHKKNMMEVTDAAFMQVMQTNVCAVFALSREIAGAMLPRKQGCIINVSSMAAKYGIPNVIAYTASKTAIEGMTRAMAVELSPRGIRVNCVAPGFIVTDMSSRALNNDPERKRRVLERTPAGELGRPEDVAEAVLYLASDAARYVTGVVLPVDGGNSIGF